MYCGGFILSKLGSFDELTGGEGEDVRAFDCEAVVFFALECVLLSGVGRWRLRGRSDVELADFESNFESDLTSVFGVPFLVGAVPLTWAGVGVLVLAGEGAEGGGVGALAAAVVELNAALLLLLTEGLFSRSLSLD